MIQAQITSRDIESVFGRLAGELRPQPDHRHCKCTTLSANILESDQNSLGILYNVKTNQ